MTLLWNANQDHLHHQANPLYICVQNVGISIQHQQKHNPIEIATSCRTHEYFVSTGVFQTCTLFCCWTAIATNCFAESEALFQKSIGSVEISCQLPFYMLSFSNGQSFCELVLDDGQTAISRSFYFLACRSLEVTSMKSIVNNTYDSSFTP